MSEKLDITKTYRRIAQLVNIYTVSRQPIPDIGKISEPMASRLRSDLSHPLTARQRTSSETVEARLGLAPDCSIPLLVRRIFDRPSMLSNRTKTTKATPTTLPSEILSATVGQTQARSPLTIRDTHEGPLLRLISSASQAHSCWSGGRIQQQTKKIIVFFTTSPSPPSPSSSASQAPRAHPDRVYHLKWSPPRRREYGIQHQQHALRRPGAA